MKTLAGLLRQEDEISDRLIAAEVELETLEIEPGAVSSRREDLEQQIAVARDDLNLLRSKIKEARPGKKSGKQ
jgi:predicted  nucleic acid-binding Zn-ribbon protein